MMMRNSIVTQLMFVLLVPLCMASGGNNVPLPDLHTKRLLNDLQITVVPTERLGESMTIGLVVRYGSAFDTESKGGLANLVSRMFGKATVDKTMQSIQDELSYICASSR